jgi:hypothetical protein
MVETHSRLVLSQILNFAYISLSLRPLEFPQVNFLRSEFFNDGVECEEIDIFEMVVSSACLLEFFRGLSWIDSLQNAESSKVLEG